MSSLALKPMAVKETYSEPAASWPNAAELAERGERVVILPARVEETGGELIAAFRPDAQALRVNATAEGIDVELYTPTGARRGVYQEHAADWVLPVLMSVPVNLATGLLVNLIQARIDAWRARGAPAPEPEVRCGLAEIEDGAVRVHDLEGPAKEVRDILLGLGEKAAVDEHPDGGEAGD